MTKTEMSKQEEIRMALGQWLASYDGRVERGNVPTVSETIDEIIEVLDSKGAVLLAEKEWPSIFNIDENVISALEYKKKLAGFVAVEPLR